VRKSEQRKKAEEDKSKEEKKAEAKRLSLKKQVTRMIDENKSTGPADRASSKGGLVGNESSQNLGSVVGP
jgi:hypothetical protein